jgi:hypothetical protein
MHLKISVQICNKRLVILSVLLQGINHYRDPFMNWALEFCISKIPDQIATIYVSFQVSLSSRNR